MGSCAWAIWEPGRSQARDSLFMEPFDGRSAEGEAQPQLRGLGVRAPRKEPRNEQHSSHGKQDPARIPWARQNFTSKPSPVLWGQPRSNVPALQLLPVRARTQHQAACPPSSVLLCPHFLPTGFPLPTQRLSTPSASPHGAVAGHLRGKEPGLCSATCCGSAGAARPQRSEEGCCEETQSPSPLRSRRSCLPLISPAASHCC